MNSIGNNRPKFIIDQNVGKLAKLLRLLGFDSIFFTGQNDTQMVNIALEENRIILTRDTHIQERRLVTSGKIKAFLINTDNAEEQIKIVIKELNLLDQVRPFTLCLEDNHPLEPQTLEKVKNRVPPYVWLTQKEYMECPKCYRLYWKGTHWEAMTKRLGKLLHDPGG